MRSLEFIYELPTNNPRQQGEADRGSLLAIRSEQVTAEVLQSQRHRKVPECGTLENPPGSEDRMEGPAWGLPELDKFMKDFGCEEAVFNTCAYQLRTSQVVQAGGVCRTAGGFELFEKEVPMPQVLQARAFDREGEN